MSEYVCQCGHETRPFFELGVTADGNPMVERWPDACHKCGRAIRAGSVLQPTDDPDDEGIEDEPAPTRSPVARPPVKVRPPPAGTTGVVDRIRHELAQAESDVRALRRVLALLESSA